MRIDRDIYQGLALAAVRCACGRKGPLAFVVCEQLSSHLGMLDPPIADIIRETITRRHHLEMLDDECAQTEWLHLRRRLLLPCRKTEPAIDDDEVAWMVVAAALRSDTESLCPALEACEYEELIEKNRDRLTLVWATRLTRTLVRAEGEAGGLRSMGLERDPEGFRSLHETLVDIYRDITGRKAPRSLMPSI